MFLPSSLGVASVEAVLVNASDFNQLDVLYIFEETFPFSLDSPPERARVHKCDKPWRHQRLRILREPSELTGSPKIARITGRQNEGRQNEGQVKYPGTRRRGSCEFED